MKNKLYFLIIGMLIIASRGLAQDDPQMTQFLANKLYYNPAATGSDDLLHASLSDREQWVGYDNRPSYRMLNASQFFTKQKFGLGLSVLDYKANVEHNLNIKLAYSYHLQVQDQAYLAMGISGGFVNRSTDDVRTVSGQNIGYNSSMVSDINAGLEFYTSDIIIGASVTHVPAVLGDIDAKMRTHFYAYGTYYYQVNKEWMLSPTLIFRNSSFISNFEVNGRAIYKDFIMGGFSYRVDAVAFMAGINITENLGLSYSYDVNLGDNNTHGGTHEITLSFRMSVLKQSSTFDRLNN